MARFMTLMFENYDGEVPFYSSKMYSKLKKEDREILKGLGDITESVDRSLEKFRFADAADTIYHFMWEDLASKYIEQVKGREDRDVALSVLRYVFLNCLKLLHPFMPFVTEEIWGKFPKEYSKPLIVSSWPENKKW